MSALPGKCTLMSGEWTMICRLFTVPQIKLSEPLIKNLSKKLEPIIVVVADWYDNDRSITTFVALLSIVYGGKAEVAVLFLKITRLPELS